MEDDDHAAEYARQAEARSKVKSLLSAIENAFASHDHGEAYQAQFTAARSEADTALDAFEACFAPGPVDPPPEEETGRGRKPERSSL